MAMSLVRRPLDPYISPSQPQIQTQIPSQSQAPTAVKIIDINTVNKWYKMSSDVRKIRPHESVRFQPISELREVKNGQAWVVTAYVYVWRDPNGNIILQNTIANIYMQKMLATAIKSLMMQFGIGNFVVDVKNEGKPEGKPYYKFDISYGLP